MIGNETDWARKREQSKTTRTKKDNVLTMSDKSKTKSIDIELERYRY